MEKIRLIIVREFLTRVKKKIFLIMTLVTPFLIVLIGFAPVIINKLNLNHKTIAVIDASGDYKDKLENSSELTFVYLDVSFEEAKKTIYSSEYAAVLNLNAATREATFDCVYKTQLGLRTIKSIEKNVANVIERKLLKTEHNLTDKDILAIQPKIKINSFYRSEDGKEEKKDIQLNSIVGYLAGVLIYMFIFLYGVQVMRGVIEEKSNRIVEVMISSVKPFELMLGKIIGVALVGITQFMLWVVLTILLYSVLPLILGADIFSGLMETDPSMLAGGSKGLTEAMVPGVFSSIAAMPWLSIFISFFIYFLGGYLLYSSLFAAIGAMVDNEADTQQFMFPITVPILVGLFMGQAVINDPDSSLAFWGSMIPFISPIVMMFRVPFGVPLWQLALSSFLLFGGFFFMTKLSSRIYRVGILMYGKKPSYKEVWKWFFYKE